MNEYDPMKDGASEQAQRHQSKAERQNTGGDPDGREYTNPDGSHGYVYNAQNVYRDSNHLNFRNAFITVLTLLIALILAICCLGGAMIASLSLEAEESTQGSADGDGTSNGIFISDETDSENENGTELYPSVPGGNHNTQDHETAPDLDSITKLPPERVDENGDGRPDIVFGEDGQVLTSAGTGILTVATVVARVADSVVEITAETVTQSDWVKPAVSSGAGSGVIISHEGYIVTNHHVIAGASRITVRLNDGTEFEATLVGSDEQTDIAVIHIQAGSKKLTVATLGASYDLVVGEDVIAIGNPLGALGGTVTEGMISATARQIRIGGNVMTLLQTSAPVNPGNSGGGLFNLAGELVGIVNAKITTEDVEGLGFAVPVDTVYNVVLELIHYGYVRGRSALDFAVVDVTSYQLAYYYFNSAGIGVFVYDKNHDTVKYGDRILTADGKTITESSQLDEIVRSKPIGSDLTLTVKRGKKELTLTVTVTEYVPKTVQTGRD
jgi:serine protease Do